MPRMMADQDLEQRLRQLQAVADLGQRALGCEISLDGLFALGVETVRNTLDVEYAMVLELLPDGTSLLLRSGGGWREGLVGTATVGAGLDSQAGYTLFRENFVIVEDLATDRRFNGPPLLVEHGVRSGLSTVIGNGDVFGVLGAHTRARRHFTEADGQFLRAVANVLGAAVARAHADAALGEQHAILLQSQRLGHVGSYVYDVVTGACTWTDELFRITGRDPDAGAPDVDAYVKMYTRESQGRIRDSIAKYGADGQPFELDLELTRPDGQRRRVVQRGGEATGMPGGSTRIVGVLQDVTEQRQAAERLAQALRVEAIGRLSAGMAHDFNNLLTPILGFSSACLDRLPPGDPMRADLLEIQQAAATAADLTRGLLTVACPQASTVEVVDLNDLVRQAARLLSSIVGEEIALSLELVPSAMPVRVGAAHVIQTLTNLATNARDAMPGGGALVIGTAPAVLEAVHPLVRSGTVPGPGAYVLVSVRDTGYGMAEDVLSRAFDPFFTTKGMGAGTGLGLATVYTQMRQSGGGIDAESAPGEGTTIRLYFPQASQAAQPVQTDERAWAPEARIAARRTILLVDDNDAVRRLASRVLTRHGYEVLEAHTGAAALAAAAQHEGRIDLVLTDVVMPGMSGPTLVDQLVSTRRTVKALYMSGYMGEGLGEPLAPAPERAVLWKPFSSAALADHVRQALDA